MRFSVFDHMDRGGMPLGQQYQERLQLIEAYDRAGFHAYHLAEHHGTPLGLASAPSVFLAAVSQRTRRLRFGPLVYTLSLYHPLRVIEEICMLDHLSGGRLELGIGKGVSPIELGFFGVGLEAQQKYEECLALVLEGLEHGRLNFSGAFFTFKDVELELRPLQRPRPPLWYGVAKAETAPWAAQMGMNIVTNGPATDVARIVDRFKAEWAAGPHAGKPLPHVGMSRHVVIAETDEEAIELATPAYHEWFTNLLYLWRKNGVQIPLSFPDNFAGAAAMGLSIAGSVSTVRDRLREELRTSGVNYLLCRIAFGKLPFEQSLQTVRLMQHEIIPAFVSGTTSVAA